MTRFGYCKHGVWDVDDFTPCVQRDYIDTIIPLTACAISLLTILITSLGKALHGEQDQTKQVLAALAQGKANNGNDNERLVDIDGENVDILKDSGGKVEFNGNEGKLLQAELVRPKGEVLVCTVELLLVALQVAMNIYVLGDEKYARKWQIATFSRLAAWAYLLLLLTLRMSKTLGLNVTLRSLWGSTVFLYAIQLVRVAIGFRTAILHSEKGEMLVLQSVSFASTILLFLIAFCSMPGNRAVLMIHDKKLTPSPELASSLLSRATFSWFDHIVLLGYKRQLELVDIFDLQFGDRAVQIVDTYRLFKRTSSLAWHLARFFKKDILFQAIFSTVGTILAFAPAVLIKKILEYLEDPAGQPRSMAWLYVTALPLCGLVEGVVNGQSLWRGRLICIRLRAILVAEVYRKTLRRKAAVAGDDESKDDSNDITKDVTLPDRFIALFSKKRREANKAKQEHGDKPTSSGTIINLMSVDTQKVSEICAYLHFVLPSIPLELVLVVGLLFYLLGWSAIAGIAVVVLLIPINMWFASRFTSFHKIIMTATDKRIHATNEVLNNVRVVKYFAWEDRFIADVNEKRSVELNALWRRCIMYVQMGSVWILTPVAVAAGSFFLFTVVQGEQLRPSIAFTAMTLFNLLRQPLDRLSDMLARLFEAKVSVDRVEKYLAEDETEKYDQLAYKDDSESGFVGFRDTTLSWGVKGNPSATDAFRLINMNVTFQQRSLNIIVGPTGSGKTSMLMGLLGEMTMISGSVSLPGNYVRGELQVDSEGLTDSVAYCAQQAWLLNDTIKQNILFASPYNERRYKQVIEACALTRDLEILQAGDATLVGEKGIVVSGGQKQRISLARALYSNSRYVLLDDCLSAVDSHTAQHIFENCIDGRLMKGRTCILVTHNISLCLQSAKHVVVLENGKIAGQGSPDEVRHLLGEEANAREQKAASKVPDGQASIDDATDEAGADTTHVKSDNAPAENVKADADADDSDANRRTEEIGEGNIGWNVIGSYIDAIGPWWFWTLIFVACIVAQAVEILPNWWVRTWANSYIQQPAQASSSIHFAATSSVKSAHGEVGMYYAAMIPSQMVNTSLLQLQAAREEHSAMYYLGVYVALGLAVGVIGLSRNLLIFKGSINASTTLHERLIQSVLRAKLRFFDSTPLGQIINRFSKDMSAIDQEIAFLASFLIMQVLSTLTIIIVVSVITPAFLIAAALLSMVYIAVGIFYISSSRDLKRIESSQRSPLYQQFGETLAGVTTIRAYGDEKRFILDNADRVNAHARPFIYLWAANRWLALRVDWAGSFVSFAAALFVVLRSGQLDAGTAGLSLSYATTFNESILWLVRMWSETQQNLSHVERIKVFLDVEQEAPAQIPDRKPASNWPTEGAISIQNYSTRYRDDLDNVLKNMNVEIAGRQKVGIVGRTGAGKSSLALALFRGLEPTSGKIVIDGVDTSLIGLKDLREAITIVPQDPTLFTGTIRSNLDPFNLFTDEEVFEALRKVHLIGSGNSGSTTVAVPSPKSSSSGLNQLTQGIESAAQIDLEQSAGGARADLTVPHKVIPADALAISEDTTTANSEENLDLSKTMTNTRENANIFLNLSSPVAESGTNLSQGQRQLLCLARALLKNPKVLVMDEATASIDYATDNKIQQTLRDVSTSTIITIAHRLQTIIDYDMVLVLDQGEVAEYDTPWNLISKEGTIFRGMCETTGEMESLTEAAKKKDQASKLVEV